jgi:hypothetical protein
VVVFPREVGRSPAHAVSSPLPVEQVTRAGRGLRATVRAAAPGRFAVVAADGNRRFRGVAEVRDPLSPVPLGGDWSVRLERPGAEPADRPLGSWTEIEPGFSGSAVYARALELDAATLAGRRWILDLGDVRDVAEVSVNGRALPARLWAPYRLDVTGALTAGRNVVAVRVTNTGANARGEARASGLLGPVTLRPERRVRVELDRVRRGPLLELEADPPALAPGQRGALRVRVRDLFGRPGRVELTASGEGVDVQPASAHVRLGADGEGEAEIELAAPVDAPIPGRASVVLSAGEAEHSVEVRLDSATRLGRASASSSYPGRPPGLAIDGIADPALWDQGQGWNDGTADAYPDELTVAFDAPAPIGRVRVHTLGSEQYPARDFGIADFDVQLREGGSWRTVGEVRGNERGVVELAFAPAEADAVRLVIGAARVSYSRVIELEALPPPSGPVDRDAQPREG